MSFKIGNLTKTKVPRHLSRFAPVRLVRHISDVEPTDLTRIGKKLILLDADNTLLPWRGEELAQEVIDWVSRARAAGLKFCLVSNTRNRPRLERLANLLDCPAAVGKFKPSREMYQWALNHFKLEPKEALMVGDQLLTDVFGASRSGIESILVKPISEREFIGTKFNRFWEKLIMSRLVHAIEKTTVDDLEIAPHTGVFQMRVVRQFLKFCIVGGSSFVIDYCIRLTLMEKTQVDGASLSQLWGSRMLDFPLVRSYASVPADAFFPLAAACGAAIAIMNSFIWNRMWTFNLRGKEEAATQFVRFFVIAVSGLVLNVVFSGLFHVILPGSPEFRARAATVLAAALVAFWNFFGQRLYAFRVEKT